MDTKKLSNEELVRWGCLFECLYTLQKQCKKKDLDFDYILKKKLKPNHIKEYIENRFPIVCNNMETGQYLGDFFNELIYDGKD